MIALWKCAALWLLATAVMFVGLTWAVASEGQSVWAGMLVGLSLLLSFFSGRVDGADR